MNRTQLLRLLDEAHAVLTSTQIAEMSISMDVTEVNLKATLEGATAEWEAIKDTHQDKLTSEPLSGVTGASKPHSWGFTVDVNHGGIITPDGTARLLPCEVCHACYWLPVNVVSHICDQCANARDEEDEPDEDAEPLERAQGKMFGWTVGYGKPGEATEFYKATIRQASSEDEAIALVETYEEVKILRAKGYDREVVYRVE
jgi:hypothetical protein